MQYFIKHRKWIILGMIPVFIAGLVWYQYLKVYCYDIGITWSIPFALAEGCRPQIDGSIDSLPCKHFFDFPGEYMPGLWRKDIPSIARDTNFLKAKTWIFPDSAMCGGASVTKDIRIDAHYHSRRINSVSVSVNCYRVNLEQLKFSPIELYVEMTESLNRMFGKRGVPYGQDMTSLQILPVARAYINTGHVWEIGDSGRVISTFSIESWSRGKERKLTYSIDYSVHIISKDEADKLLSPLQRKEE